MKKQLKVDIVSGLVAMIKMELLGLREKEKCVKKVEQFNNICRQANDAEREIAILKTLLAFWAS